jgi:methyl-accepting chemotaxis protein
MRNVEDDPFDRHAVVDPRIGVLVREERQLKSVSSLTDYLLQNTFSDWRMDRLSEKEAANERKSLLAYHLEAMKGAALCHVPPAAVVEGSELPQIDVAAMTSIGTAMAMLILSVIQNELMLNTQLESVKGTQSQKLAASQTKMLEIRQQIQKSRYKSGFQKFMEWLSSTWLMKFLNSNYGKIIMFALGAIATIASFGTAGPAVIAISAALLSFQAAELILGKSMGELLTQSMDDGAAKMALQMSIDVGLMIADIATGAGGGAKVDKVTKAAGDTMDATQKAMGALTQTKKAAEAAETAAKGAAKGADVVEAAQGVQKAADEAADAVNEASKLTGELDSLVVQGASTAEIGEKTKALDKALDRVNESTEKLKKAGEKLQDVTGSAVDQMGEATEEVGKTGEKLQDATGSAVDQMGEATEEVGKAGENLQDAKGSEIGRAHV